MENGAIKGIENEENLVPESEYKKLEQRIKNLERLLGRKTEENEILKEAVILARKKTDLAKAIGRNRRFPMTRIASALGVSRSIFYYKNRVRRTKHSIRNSKSMSCKLLKTPAMIDYLRVSKNYGNRQSDQ